MDNAVVLVCSVCSCPVLGVVVYVRRRLLLRGDVPWPSYFILGGPVMSPSVLLLSAGRWAHHDLLLSRTNGSGTRGVLWFHDRSREPILSIWGAFNIPRQSAMLEGQRGDSKRFGDYSGYGNQNGPSISALEVL